MKPQSWRPLAYLGTTLGAVGVVLAAACGAVRLANPSFSLADLRGGQGKAVVVILGWLAFTTVLGTTWLLKRRFGREPGTALDDPDRETAEPGPGEDQRCPRCRTRFAADDNDAYRAGFCSRACRDAFARREPPSTPI